jgi:hypothetical protein
MGAAVVQQAAHDMHVLTGKILVDEEEVHGREALLFVNKK